MPETAYKTITTCRWVSPRSSSLWWIVPDPRQDRPPLSQAPQNGYARSRMGRPKETNRIRHGTAVGAFVAPCSGKRLKRKP